MPTVRLSGKTLSANESVERALRAKLLFLIYNAGWDINNASGKEQITLSNIEKKIIESDCFVFTPGASLEDLFKAVSIFVGYQTIDQNLSGKPTVILNSDASWDPLFNVLSHLGKMGTVKQDYREFLLLANSPEEVLARLDAAKDQEFPDAGREEVDDPEMPTSDTPPPSDFLGNVCVFCSATLEDPGYIADGEELGRILARNKFGCVSGAGKSGIMGAVVRGSVEAGGWTAGSNVPHIIKLEGLPAGLSRFWLRPDIYTRMEVMIENSDAFVIFPGGAGTVQELLALLIFLEQGDDLMKGKPVIIFNRLDEEGRGFWDPLITLLGNYCQADEFRIAQSIPEIQRLIEEAMQPA